MPYLRNVEEKDLQEINLLLAKSFTHAREHEGLKHARVPLCRQSFLRMYAAANSTCSLVIEEDRRVIGYCFSRLWGQVGWIGPLSVLPSHQGRGQGKVLVQKAVDCLNKQGARTIGLETAAYSSKNLAFYTKLGFVPEHLTVDVVRETPSQDPTAPSGFTVWLYSRLGPDERAAMLQKSTALSEQLHPGLNYCSEIELVARFGFGDAMLVLQQSEPVAFVLAHTGTYSQEEERFFLKVNIMQLKPGEPLGTLDVVLDLLDLWASAEGLQGVYVRANTRYYQGFSRLLSRGFRTVHNELRMTFAGHGLLDDPQTVNFSKWE